MLWEVSILAPHHKHTETQRGEHVFSWSWMLTGGWTEDGYLLQHEWPVYTFDALPMAVVLVFCLTFYVALYQPEDRIKPESNNDEHLMSPQDRT